MTKTLGEGFPRHFFPPSIVRIVVNFVPFLFLGLSLHLELEDD